jgi:hypothetical protein
VSGTLTSCTSKAQAYVARRAPMCYPKVNELLNGRRIVLLDTPGDDPEPYSPGANLSIVLSTVQWLESM